MSVNDVREFHEKFECAINESLDNEILVKQRVNLIFEEFKEVLYALGYSLGVNGNDIEDSDFAIIVGKFAPPDKKEVMKELADLEYVVQGTAIAFGLPHEEVVKRVHENNLTKIFPDGTIKRRKDGKILKPDNYKKVDLSDLV